MKIRRGFVAILTGLISAAGVIQCTKAPLSDDPIAEAGSTIRGKVSLSGTHSEDVYVWLEGLNLSARTDRGGNFTIEMPKSADAISADGFAGVYTLYFYVANYSLATADVVIRNGRFVTGEGDLGPDGKLVRTVSMSKILDVFTIVQPRSVYEGYRDKIDVQVTLRAALDPVQVVFPKSVGGLLGAILILDLTTGDVFVDVPDVGADDSDYDIITITPESRRLVFHLDGVNYRNLFLPTGNYEIIPYFLIIHEDMPAGLLESMGGNVTQVSPEFLNIPVRRNGGLFELQSLSERIGASTPDPTP